jgi:hypothetical protein
VLLFPGDVRLTSSLVDGQPAWGIFYDGAAPFVGHDFQQFFDEMREVSRAGAGAGADGADDGWL